MEIFAGMPLLGGVLPRAARAAAIPIMVSANAFAKGKKPGQWRTSTPDLEGSRVVLDSAGFVAMKLYGGHRWSAEQYIALAAQLRPEWYASMDFCCEPEVAGSVEARQWMTRKMWGFCRRAADEVGIPPPMPVVQGWAPEDYLEHAEEMDGALRGEWPSLVGVGSVCRRPLRGPTGLLRVIRDLDETLPGHVKLHLFGVKSAAIDHLGRSPRVASVDSMAWDFGARRKGDSTVLKRAEALLAWYGRQQERCGAARPYQASLLRSRA